MSPTWVVLLKEPLSEADIRTLRQWIDKPSSVRLNAAMPPLNPEAKNRAALLSDLIAYLKAMAGKKIPAPKKA